MLTPEAGPRGLLIADVPLFHIVGYARVGPRIAFTPTMATNSEVQLQTITFTD